MIGQMIRLLPSLAFIALLLAGPAAAQPPRAASPGADSPALSQTQARAALEVLRDDTKRAQLIAVLEAIARLPHNAAAAAAASPPAPAAGTSDTAGAPATGATVPAPADAAALPLAPDSVGAELLSGATRHLSGLSEELGAQVRALADFPLLANWFISFALDPVLQAQALDVGWRLILMLAVGLGIELGIRRGLRRPIGALERRAPPIAPPSDPPAEDFENEAEVGQTERLRRRLPVLLLLRRLPFALGHFLLELLPILGFLAAGYVIIGALGDGYTSRLVMIGVLHAYAVWRAVIAVLRLLVAPGAPQIRLVGVSEDGARYLQRWTRRIAALGVFGYAGAEIGLLFGLYWIAYEAVLKLVWCAVTVCLVVVVWQTREAVATRVRAVETRSPALGRLRNRLAGSWHVFAIFYLLALWLVGALDIQDGFSRLLRLVVAAGVVGVLARTLTVLALGAFERALVFPPETTQIRPGLATRIRAYQPLGRALIVAIISAVSLVVLAEAWGFDAFSWFSSGGLGGRLVGALTTIGVTLAAALLVWELANAGIQSHLERLGRDAQAARSARLRTLLPMLRTTLLGGICVVAGLMILSEIGVNIAPLLAGAGVIGLAIGFGSQKLVQDIITGLFLLLENTMQVGDVVSLGGLSGTVENLSIRTIRLRALDGSVHIIPFSAVTTVTNQTRDFGYAVVDVSVGLNEDPAHVAGLLRDVAHEMRAEPHWRHAIHDELDVMGVDHFLDTALVLRTRLKTVPGQRWAVARELTQRIKKRFDDLAIESPWTSHRALGIDPPVESGDAT